MLSAFIIATTPPSSRPQIAAVHTIRGVVETSALTKQSRACYWRSMDMCICLMTKLRKALYFFTNSIIVSQTFKLVGEHRWIGRPCHGRAWFERERRIESRSYFEKIWTWALIMLPSGGHPVFGKFLFLIFKHIKDSIFFSAQTKASED